jgi:hypothetical protein
MHTHLLFFSKEKIRAATTPSLISSCSLPFVFLKKNAFLFLFLLFTLLFSFSAEASHYRGGTISTVNQGGNCAQINITQTWRRSSFGAPIVGNVIGGGTLFFGDGGNAAISLTVTEVNLAEDILVGSFTVLHCYATPGPWTANYSNCCRLSALQNNANGTFQVETTFNLAGTDSSPISTTPQEILMTTGQAMACFQTTVTDPNVGDVITYGLATPAQMSGGTNPASLAIDAATGKITFNTVGRPPGQIFSGAVTATDNNGNQIMIDFVILIVSQPPFFDAPTPADNATINVCVGNPVSFTVKGVDPEMLNVTLTSSALPGTATMTAALPQVGIPAMSIFNWTPTAADLGNHDITYTITDAPDVNVVTRTFHVVVACDPAGPILQTAPADINVACAGDVPPAVNRTVSMNCGATMTSVAPTDVITPGSCANKFTITRTWIAVDLCENIAQTTQIITVNDNIKPVLPPAPADATLICAGDVPTPAASTLTATNNCGDANQIVIPVDVVTPGSCANKFSIVRTWTATDACGNTSQRVQNISVNDNVKPVLPPAPADVVVKCASGVPAKVDLTATNNCGEANQVVVPTDAVTPGSCVNKFSIVRTWTATDACGNSSQRVQNITVNDDVLPTFDLGCQMVFNFHTSGSVVNLDPNSGGSTCPEFATFSLNVGDVVSVSSRPTAAGILMPNLVGCFHDNCTSDANMRAKVISIDNVFFVCTRTITVKYRSVDECNNESAALFTCIINITDDTKPTVQASCDITFRLGTDGAAAPLVRTANKKSGAAICPEVATTNLSINQVITANQTWTVAGIIIPNLLGCLKDNCTADANMRARVSNITNTFDGCERTFVFSFRSIDACNNLSDGVTTTTVVVRDDTKPVFTKVPPHVTVDCNKIPTKANNCFDSTPSVSDNCDATPTIVFVGETKVDGNCPYNFDLYRTWTVTDDCNNTSTYTQNIHVIDTIKPVFQPLANEALDCGFPGLAVRVVTDYCSPNNKIKVDYLGETVVPGSCPKALTYTRRWFAKDECGNTATSVQVIKVQDKTPPMFIYTPPMATITCSATPNPEPPKIMDNCSAMEDVTIKLTATDCIMGQCPVKHTLKHTWKATDLCGNAATWDTYTLVKVTQPPTFTYFPPNLAIGQDAVPSITLTNMRPTAKDECGDNASVALFSETKTAGQCVGSEVITRVWKAIDKCDNESVQIQTITTGDKTFPKFNSNPPKLFMTYETFKKYTYPTLTAKDDCGNVTITGPVVTRDKSCDNGFASIFLTWTATDITGNTATTSQVIAINDASPAVTVTAPTQIVCGTSDQNINANVTGGVPPYHYQWLSTKNVWNILSKSDTANITVGAYNGKGEFNVIVTDSRGCKGAAYFYKECLWDDGAHCTQTESFYGTPTDSLKKMSSVDVLKKAFAYDVDGDGKGDSIFIGNKKRNITIFADAVACFDALFPAALGKADTLKNDTILVNKAKGCKAKGLELTASGQLKNPLLTQLITLAINIRHDPTLGYLPLRKACSASKMIDSFANKHLEDIARKDSTRTVKVLYRYANDVIAGRYNPIKQKYLDSLTLALQTVNECYKSCLDAEQIAEQRSFAEIGLVAKVYGAQSQLRWTKLISNDVRSFEIQHSVDNQKFKKVLVLQNPYSDKNAHRYEAIHPFPIKGMNYYRILQYFKDGTSSYSNTATIEFLDNPEILKVFPNPAQNEFYISLRSFADKKIDFVLSNELGQDMDSFTFEKMGTDAYRFDSNHLQSGVYFLRASSDRIPLGIVKIVIQK